MARKPDSQIFLIHDLDEASRTIYLTDLQEGESEAQRASRFIKSLMILDRLAPNGDKDINVILNHEGGSVFDGIGIYDAIINTKNPVIMTVYGSAMSMGAIILQAADVRVLSPHSVVMIHHGHSGMEGHKRTVESWIDFSKEYDKKLDEILFNRIKEKKPKFTRKELDKLLNFDTIFTAEQALEMGLADSILGDQDV